MNFCFYTLLAIGLLAPASPAIAACDTSLKPTDDYRTLAGKLECLHNRILALEKGSSAAGRVATKPPLNKAVALNGGKIIGAIKECAWSKQNGDLYCTFLLENKTVEDQKICLGSESRIVTDDSQALSKATRYHAGFGGKSAYAGRLENGDIVCDLTPPMTRVEAWLRFENSKGVAKSKVQFVRLDCGSGCTIDAHEVEIK